MLKAIKFFTALLLLPAVMGIGRAIWRLISESTAQNWWGGEFFFPWMAGGAILGSGILFFFPVPLRTYVAGHELTHALWAKMCGGRVSKIHIKADSGYVISDCDNFLVTLAPYVFPFYAWVAWCVFAAAYLIFQDQLILKAGWVAIGMALSFHYYFLCKVIFTRQSDFKSQGYIFSYVVILLGNGLILLVICMFQKSKVLEWRVLLTDFAGSYRESFVWLKHFLTQFLTFLRS